MKYLHNKFNSPGALVLLCTVVMIAFCGCSKERVLRGEISPVQMITFPDFQNIDSVVVDGRGRIYVSDIYAVRVFSSDGKFITSVGRQGSENGEFTNEVIGLAINSRNELYVVDQDAARVQIFDLEGNARGSFGIKGTGDGEFLEPQGITIDPLDLVYVSDKLRNDVQVFSRGGEYLYSFGKSGAKGTDLDEPESMAIHKGRLYVADEENQRVQIYDLRGKHLGHLPHSGVFALATQLEASLDDVAHLTDVEKKFHRFLDGDIEGLAFDGRGLLYLLNEDDGEIFVFSKEILVGIFTSTQPILSGDGLAFDADEQLLYVVDQGNSRVQVFEVDQIYKLLNF